MKAPEKIILKSNHWWGENGDTLDDKKEGGIVILCFGDERARNLPYVVKSVDLSQEGKLLGLHVERYRAKKPAPES